MRVQAPLHVVHSALPEQAGYTLRTHALARAQAAVGMRPQVAVRPANVLPGHDRLLSAGVAVWNCDEIPYFRRTASSRLARAHIRLTHFLRDRHVKGTWLLGRDLELPDDPWEGFIRPLLEHIDGTVVHVHTPAANFNAGRRLSESLNVPLVYEVRGFWELSMKADSDRGVVPDAFSDHGEQDTHAARSADAVITLGAAMRSELIRRGVEAHSVHIVPNGVDTERFQRAERKDPSLTSKLALEGAFVLGYATNVRRLEGIDTVLRALRGLGDMSRPVVFVLVGEGSDLPRLRRLVDEWQLRQSVRLVGRVAHPDIWRYYSLFDAFVVPRTNDEVCRLVTPIKPLEAMAMGIPTVVSDLPALREVVEPGVTGEVFTPEDPAALASLITALVENPHHRGRISEAGARWVRAERTWSRSAKLTREIYHHVQTLREGGRAERHPTMDPLDARS